MAAHSQVRCPPNSAEFRRGQIVSRRNGNGGDLPRLHLFRTGVACASVGADVKRTFCRTAHRTERRAPQRVSSEPRGRPLKRESSALNSNSQLLNSPNWTLNPRIQRVSGKSCPRTEGPTWALAGASRRDDAGPAGREELCVAIAAAAMARRAFRAAIASPGVRESETSAWSAALNVHEIAVDVD